MTYEELAELVSRDGNLIRRSSHSGNWEKFIRIFDIFCSIVVLNDTMLRMALE